MRLDLYLRQAKSLPASTLGLLLGMHYDIKMTISQKMRQTTWPIVF